jgi:ABC-type sugar transport system, ATPase component
MTLLKMRGISKSFGPNRALTDVNLTLEAGQVLGLLGENGAGKSTLIKILAGAHRPDSGTIEIDGQPVVMHSPATSIAAGIAVIYQELTIVPEMSVAENIFLGNVPRVKGIPWIKRNEMNQRATEILKNLHLDINPRALAGSLTPGYQQMVEIGRALNRNARILVMDEPTSSLSKQETVLLQKLVKHLQEQGIGIIYISHHLEEIFEMCDNSLVLRDGRVIEERPTAEWTSDEMVTAMVNKSIDQFYPYEERELGEVTLKVEHLHIDPLIEDISFEARRGEIVGLAGTLGSGRSELLKAIFGAHPYQSGNIRWLGKDLKIKSTGEGIKQGMALVPGDRKIEGLVLDQSIENNIALSILNEIATLGWVSNARKRQLALAGIKQFSIKAKSGPRMVPRSLSGGNQQKVVFARTAATKPQLFLLDEPTRGVDVGAKVEVYNQIMQLAAQGCTIIISSSELPELLGLSDRILVLNSGRIVGNLSRAEATHEGILSLSTDERVANSSLATAQANTKE